MTIFEALRKDHDLQRELLKQLVSTSGDTTLRRNIFEKLKQELKLHADAEERYFYKPLIDSDLTQDHSRHGIAEHHQIDKTIEELEEMEFDSTGWLTVAKRLQEQVLHHLQDEEHKIFQLAGKALTEKSKSDLAEGYMEEMSDTRYGKKAS